MALTKRLYKDHETVITAQNMNDIQDAIIELEQMAGIVPGEGETTKVVNVINDAGNMTAAQAAAHPDGLYWVANPVTFQDSAKTESVEVSGLAAKSERTWCVYSTGALITTDENGVLLEWIIPDQSEEAPTATDIAVVKSDNVITISVLLEDGSTSEHKIILDADGYPEEIQVDDVSIPVSWEGFDE